MTKIAINCCCNAGKLIGFVDVPSVPSPAGEFQDPQTFKLTDGCELTLPAGYVHGRTSGTDYVALKSMDTPIETLRKIPSFVENTEPSGYHRNNMQVLKHAPATMPRRRQELTLLENLTLG